MRRHSFLIITALALAWAGCGGEDPTNALTGSGTGGTLDAGTGSDGTATTGGDTTGGTTGELTDATGGDTGGQTTGVEDGGTTATGEDPDGVGPDGGSTGDDADIIDVLQDTDGGGTGPGPDVDGGGGGTGDDADTQVGPIDAGPVDPCVADLGCEDKALVLLCDSATCSTYKNDCFAFCDKDNYDNLVPYAGSCCDNDQPECVIAGCDPAWAGQAAVHVVVGDTCVEYDNPFDACCNGGYDWTLDASLVIPGACETVTECGATCATDSAPICALQNGEQVEYLNVCFYADCTKTDASATIECAAGCPDTVNCPACANTPCSVVCGANGQTYRNSCYAACAGAEVQYAFACPDCPEPQAGDEVCGINGQTYDSLCLLTAAGIDFAYDTPCVAGCTVDAEADPVDGVCGTLDGSFQQFPNLSCAEAAGASCVYEGLCSFGTNHCAETNPEYDPVCGTVDDSTTGMPTERTFPNACHAGCAGAASVNQGVCASCQTYCGTATAPAYCAPDTCTLYPNACVPTKCIDPPYTFAELTKNECPTTCN